MRELRGECDPQTASSGGCKMPGCPWPQERFGLCLQHLFQTGRANHCAQCGHLFVCPDGHYRRQKYCSKRCVIIMLAQRRRRVPLNPTLLQELYIAENKNLREIGRRFGVAESNVNRALVKLGIERRARGRVRAQKLP